MSRKAGQVQHRERPRAAQQMTGKRPRLGEVESLHSTYGAEKPVDAKLVKAAGDRAVRWIESNLRHYQGRWAGRPFYLLAWQKRLIRELFGWRRADGARLYRRCYVEAPRKSGKTMLAAAVAAKALRPGRSRPQRGQRFTRAG